ncbi:MAG: hypothetical protein VX672_06585 [Planctomycetota bacterium]|nr:hypothetical protein [Planctomycetota bacterium]
MRTGRLLSAATEVDDPARDGVRLGVVAFTTIASVLGLLVLGALSGRVGVDAWLGAGALARTLPETFVDGCGLSLVMLRSLYGSGVENPLFFAAAMALIIPPIAGLVAARPRTRGGARPRPVVMTAGGLTAALIIGADLLVAIRLSSPMRGGFESTSASPDWLPTLRNLAAADGVTMIFAVLLAILVFRLPLDRWLRGLAGSIAIATAVAATALASASSGVVDLVERPLPVVETGDGEAFLIVGGTTTGRIVGITAEGAPARTLLGPDREAVIVGRRSIAERLLKAAPNLDQRPPDPLP